MRLGLPFDDNAVDRMQMQQMRQEQARRPAADDRDLSAAHTLSFLGQELGRAETLAALGRRGQTRAATGSTISPPCRSGLAAGKRVCVMYRAQGAFNLR